MVIHRGPPLHPGDVTVDLAEELTRDELVEAFERAREFGLLEIEAVEASARRVEWRPSLPMVWDVIDEFRE